MEKNADGCKLFFLKAFSEETDLLVTIGDFTVKTKQKTNKLTKMKKIGKGSMYLTENRFSGNKILAYGGIHKHMHHICAKEFFDWNISTS